jgi:Protein of unknown function (DUF2924)
MSVSMAEELAGLHRLTVQELQARYVQAFGTAPNCHHKAWLRKRIAWRLQAAAEGELSRRARARAAALAKHIIWRLAQSNDTASEVTPSDSQSETAPRAMAAAAPTPADRARAARDDGAGFDFAVDRTMFFVADALTAAGMKLVEMNLLAGAGGGVGFNGDGHEAELEQAGPTGAAARGGRTGQRRRGRRRCLRGYAGKR